MASPPGSLKEIRSSQDGNLSRIVFDIFFDDIRDIFDPLPFQEGERQSLLAFAADLATLSLSKAGLQDVWTVCLTDEKMGLESE